ncbi:MAG TPA: ABC transporter permease [Candidatus Angelobacter sp.]|nr:ABC transporter permease [Candidatus Angelobacter sp.]
MNSFVTNVRHSLRQLRKSPGFTLTAVLTLSLAIGAVTAIFSIVESVLLRPLPFHDPERLVILADNLEGVQVDGNGGQVTAPDIVAYTRDTHTFERMGGYTTTTYEVSGAGEPYQAQVARLGAGVLPTLGVSPLLGRVFTQEDETRDGHVTVLSYGFWQSHLHADPNAIGSKVLLDRKPYVVVGVMPRNFEFPLLPGRLNQSELWIPLSFSQADLTQRAANWNYQMVARLKHGVTAEQAQTDSEIVAQQIMRGYPAFMNGIRIHAVVRSLQQTTVAQARSLLKILFLAVLVVLLIACANLAGLLLVRAIRNRREIAVRLALGARRTALLGQTMSEGLVVSIGGGLIGLSLAALALRVVTRFLPETLPRISEISLDWKVVFFALLLAAASGLLCSLVPAFAAMRTSANDVLKESGRGVSGGHSRLRSALVVGEIAIAMILLCASGLLLRSFEKMRSVDPGMRPEHLVLANYNLPSQQYSKQAAIDSFNDELLRRLRAIPGVQRAALSSFLPMTGNSDNNGFIAEGYVPPPGASQINIAVTPQISGDYFSTMGMSLLRGRTFTEADRAGTQLVAIASHNLAERFWPNQDPIGKRVHIGGPDTPTPWVTIVGEVTDVREAGLDAPAKDTYYLPVAQWISDLSPITSSADLSGNSMFVALRSTLSPSQTKVELQSVFHSLDPQLAITQLESMEEAIDGTEAPRRFNTTLITAFATAAVLLAILGIYSVIAFTVASRNQEMAIRMALGSQRAGIARLVLRSAFIFAAIGGGLGWIGSLWTSRLIKGLLFNVTLFDPVVLVTAGVGILLFSLVAAVLPAIRAASIEPMQALRSE